MNKRAEDPKSNFYENPGKPLKSASQSINCRGLIRKEEERKEEKVMSLEVCHPLWEKKGLRKTCALRPMLC